MSAMPPLQARLKEMFACMVLRKDAACIDAYYHPDFVLCSNGERQDYDAFVEAHRRVYATAIQYAVRYDESAWLETPDRLGGRLWIATQRPGEATIEFEIVLIAAFIEGRIHRLWEATWPDWRQARAFSQY